MPRIRLRPSDHCKLSITSCVASLTRTCIHFLSGYPIHIGHFFQSLSSHSHTVHSPWGHVHVPQGPPLRESIHSIISAWSNHQASCQQTNQSRLAWPYKCRHACKQESLQKAFFKLFIRLAYLYGEEITKKHLGAVSLHWGLLFLIIAGHSFILLYKFAGCLLYHSWSFLDVFLWWNR